jgi:hypothetical protein
MTIKQHGGVFGRNPSFNSIDAVSVTINGTDVSASATDIAGLAKTDGNIIVGDGSNWVAESGATARTSLGLGSIATQDASSIAVTGGTLSGISDFDLAVANSDKLASILISPEQISGQTGCKVGHVTKSIDITHTGGVTTNTDFLIVDNEDEGWCTAYVMYTFYPKSGFPANYYSANWSVGALSTTGTGWTGLYSLLLDQHFGSGGGHTGSAVNSSGALAFRHTISSGLGSARGIGTMHAFFLYATTDG